MPTTDSPATEDTQTTNDGNPFRISILLNNDHLSIKSVTDFFKGLKYAHCIVLN